MIVSITTLNDDFFNLDVAGDIEVENICALCEFETGVPAAEIVLMRDGQLMDKKKKLNEYGVKANDVLFMKRVNTAAQGHAPAPGQGQGLPGLNFGQIRVPSVTASTSRNQTPEDDPARLRDMLLASPADVAVLKERNPPLAEALLSRDLNKFREVLQRQQLERTERQAEQIRLLNADPFDMDAQQKIAEQIRLRNVESNMEAAMEHAPESFGQVVMLYIDCVVNGYPVKAFVDSGAQMTIMSKRCAERCGIMRLVDTRWAGIAKGVGTQKIIGRVHLCEVKIAGNFFATAFSILEDQPMDMLLGLDMLKRHQCVIDLRHNCLLIGTTNAKAQFLSEADLPDHARLNQQQPAASSESQDSELQEAIRQSAREASPGQSPTK